MQSEGRAKESECQLGALRSQSRTGPDSRILSRKTKYIQLVERVAGHVLSAERPAATTVLHQKLMQSAGARNEMRTQLGELRSQRSSGGTWSVQGSALKRTQLLERLPGGDPELFLTRESCAETRNAANRTRYRTRAWWN